ncbi:MAG: fatty acid-binding protein DegV, partial [Actinobacteria bacterium]|nr:fatty acid-binding protein DegV [Actinomycetota bacterium]
MKIGFVTDSTAYLPDDLVTKHGIEVVPVRVVISGTSFAEGVEVSPDDVATAFRAGKSVST